VPRKAEEHKKNLKQKNLEEFKQRVIDIVEKWIPIGLHKAPQSYQQEAKQKIIQEIKELE
jgi:hypothetical protein